MAFGMNGGGAPQNNHLDSIWPRAPRNGKTKRECGRAACFPLTHSVSANPLVSCVWNREEKNERSRESTAGEWPSEPHTATRTQTPKRYLLFLFSTATHFRTKAHTLQERFFLAALLLWEICLRQRLNFAGDIKEN
jgi:hypothetical protein